ncbi:MAG: hypothetical protein COB49_12380 [Alphaproteobacteria bacterium]|nr:MAG: hypothetical protein COB49_12380 [Alphaproteobacteria bacterium]
MANQTPRLSTPYIISTQSQKEVTHNMALNMLDALIQSAVETSILSVPPVSPGEGELWLVGSSATGDWASHDNELAQYMGGVWQFYPAFEGMAVWLKDDDVIARYVAGSWQKGVVTANRIDISGQQVVGAQQAAISDAAGGATIDVEARTALNSLLVACRTHGLIAS